MLFDTDVLIWVLRGNLTAAKTVDEVNGRAISVVTYMELLRGARDKAEVRGIKTCLADNRFAMLPITENIGQRASIYIEEYGLAIALDIPDALIAATAIESNQTLMTGNEKHYKGIRELSMVRFRPN